MDAKRTKFDFCDVHPEHQTDINPNSAAQGDSDGTSLVISPPSATHDDPDGARSYVRKPPSCHTGGFE